MFSKLIRAVISLGNRITNYNLDRYLGYRIEKHRFYLRKGYNLNLKNPRSFCEKLVWKKIHDKNPLLLITADKYLVRNYIHEVLGKNEAEIILIPLLYVTDKPENIPFDDLPDKYIIKPSHASGKVIIIKESIPDRNQILAKCRRWLASQYGLDKNEWAYKDIQRKIIIEELLQDESGGVPDDYKLFMFNGKCHIILLCSERYSKDGTKYNLYSPDWEEMNITYRTAKGPRKQKPSSLQDMISVAEKLSAPFDFVRVDFYMVHGKIYFGELTHYPGSGWIKIEPVEFDFELGKYWDLKESYWEQNDYAELNRINIVRE